jgi:hypothetical protein
MSTARACLVTGYVRLDLPNRPHDEYAGLGARLIDAADMVDQITFGGTVDACWHWALSEGALLPVGNPEKDTRAFHAVQHEKTAWTAAAAERTDAEILVWLDYGIFHVPGVTEDLVAAFLARAAERGPRDRVGMASIWEGPPEITPVPHRVAWHCAGGAFTVPRHLALPWHQAVVDAAVRMRRRGWATWEVNDWADAWRENPGLVRAWRCDHDATLLEAWA